MIEKNEVPLSLNVHLHVQRAAGCSVTSVCVSDGFSKSIQREMRTTNSKIVGGNFKVENKTVITIKIEGFQRTKNLCYSINTKSYLHFKRITNLQFPPISLVGFAVVHLKIK